MNDARDRAHRASAADRRGAGAALRRLADLHAAAGGDRAGRGRHRAGRHPLRRRHDQPRRRPPRAARDPQPVEPDAARPSCHRRRALRSRPRRRSRRRPVNPIDLKDALAKIEGFFAACAPAGAIPLTAGGDHLISLPILRALGAGRAARHDPFRRPFRHQRPLFRRQSATPTARPSAAPSRRACSIPSASSRSASAARSTTPPTTTSPRPTASASSSSRSSSRAGRPTSWTRRAPSSAASRPMCPSTSIRIDPSMAPGTGTPEIGGITTREAQEMLRLLAGSTSSAPMWSRWRRPSTSAASRRLPARP